MYAFRGEADGAFTWLERAYAQHDGGMFLVKVDPLETAEMEDLKKEGEQWYLNKMEANLEALAKALQ